MTIIVEDQELSTLLGPRWVLDGEWQNRVFRRCRWWALVVWDDLDDQVDHWPLMKDVTFEDCLVQTGAMIGYLRMDNVVLDGFRGGLRAESCAMKHVRLVGLHDTVWIEWPEYRGPHATNALAYNASVDWSMDISDLYTRSESKIVKVVPATTIIDPSRQAIVSASSLEPGRARLEADPLPGLVGWTAKEILAGKFELETPLVVDVVEGAPGEAADREAIAALHAEGWVERTYGQ